MACKSCGKNNQSRFFVNTIPVLRSREVLPPTSKFVDPYSKEEYSPESVDTLDSMLLTITRSRKEKGLPEYDRVMMERMATACLYETTPAKQRTTYFKMAPVIPELQEVMSLTKTVVTQALNPAQATIPQRIERAEKCSKCKLHMKGSLLSSTLQTVIAKISNLKSYSLTDLSNDAIESGLSSCGMCGCVLKLKNRYDVYSVLVGISPAQLDKLLRTYGPTSFDSCWILNEAVKDKRTMNLLAGKLKNTVTGSAQLKNYLAKQ